MREKGKRERRRERKREESSTDAKVFQFSALKHEPTPQLGCPGRLLNKTFIRENTGACILSENLQTLIRFRFYCIFYCICVQGTAP